MEQGVCRILYRSVVGANKSATDIGLELGEILLTSRRQNPVHGITGVLATNQKVYAQVLEGPSEAVTELIGHIACDHRHQDFRMVSHEIVEARLFQEWSMALISTVQYHGADDQFFPDITEQTDLAAVSLFCDSLRRHLLISQGY